MMSCSVTKLEHILLSNPPNREVVVTGKAAFWNKTNLVTKPEATTFLAKQICTDLNLPYYVICLGLCWFGACFCFGGRKGEHVRTDTKV